MKVTPSIFRLYDIRGVAGKDFSAEAIAEFERWYGPFPGVNITLEIAEAIGKAYGSFMIRKFSAKNILVGHETRPFAEELNHAFIKGIRSTGCNVTDAGVTLTPIVYFGDAFFHFDGAVNITGSHNVYFFNGFKMMGKMVNPVFGEDLQELRRVIEQEDFLEATPGTLETKDLYPAYEVYAKERIHLQRPMRIVVDTGNGSAGLFARRFFTALGCEVTSLYEDVDATFPNHVPDPEERSTLDELGKKVQALKADLGIGLDADGDRVGCVDEKGRYIDSDLLVLLLAKDALSRHPGRKVLFDIKCSRLLNDEIEKAGGIPLMHRTGHAPIKKTLRMDDEIILGGEVSGHVYFVEDYFKIDDGMYAAAKLIALASAQSQPFSSLFNFPHTVRTPEMKLPCEDTKKFDIVEKVRNHFDKHYSTLDIDGVRIQFDATTWALVRASNTSPYLTIRMEADTTERLLEIKNIVADELEKHEGIGDALNRAEVSTKTGRLGWI